MTRLFGESAILASSVSSNGVTQYLRGQAIAGTAQKLYVYVGGTGGQAKLAIYSDNSGVPGTVLAQSAMTSVSANGWAALDISDVNITNGAYYWIAWHLNCYIKYATSGGTRKYKSETFNASYNFTDNPGGLTSDSLNLSMYCDGVVNSDVTVNAPTATASSTAYAPAVTGGAVSSPPVAAVSSQAPAPVVSVGPPPTTVNAPTATVTSQAHAPIAGGSSVSSPPAAMSTAQAYTVVAGPLTGVTISPPCALASSQAFTASTSVPFHIILEAQYFQEAPDVNRSFVVGQDVTGALVTGSAITQGDVDLCGERLEAQHDPAIPTGTVAGYVAAAVLAKARLDGSRGRITIPPHCGVELFDVVSVVDSGANQPASYRIIAYTLDYDVRVGKYEHAMELGQV